MTNNTALFEMNNSGEFIQNDIHELTNEKYKPDNPFFVGFIPYLLMFICVAIDIGFFTSLFKIISFESQLLIILEVAGLAFAADIVSAYAGIYAKKLAQNIEYNSFTLKLLLFVPIVALIVNALLRIMTMSFTTIDGTITPDVVALTLVSIAVPVFTSIGNFAISYITYDPLKQKLKKEELALSEINEKCRRFKAIKYDFDCDSDCFERLVELDKAQLNNSKKEILNDAFILLNDVQIQLMKCLQDPSESNVLSKSQCNDLTAELKHELDSINQLLNYSK